MPPPTPAPVPLRARVAAFEAQLIREAVRSTGSLYAASVMLATPRRTLYHRVRALGLEDLLAGSEATEG